MMSFKINVYLTFCISISMALNGPIVETTLGKFHGSILKTTENKKFLSFRGIRYAKAPLGERRFKPPEAFTEFGDSMYDATADGFICPQPRYPKELLSEDCLFLNVYTSDLEASKPVMVFIHGGSLFLGTGHSEWGPGPKRLMNHDIVLVTFNYRLGALGFLSTQNEDAPGNYGYLDQVMVLHWVQDHISKFGGNPSCVTIFGMSAGGMAVTLHMASPLSKGLFHRAIAMSGTATNHFTLVNTKWTKKLAKQVGCPMFHSKSVVECLRNVSIDRIIEACKTFETYGLVGSKWTWEVDDHFLLDHPTNVFAKGEFNKVPLMTGICRDELACCSLHDSVNNTFFLTDLSLNFDKYAPEMLKFELDKNADEKSKKIQQYYLGKKMIQDQPFGNFGKIFSDAIIGHSTSRLVNFARQHIDVFYYENNYLGKRSLCLDKDGKPACIFHADENLYIFKSKFYPDIDENDLFMAERYAKWLTSFAENGVPSDVDGVKWLPSNKNQVYALYNDKNVHLGTEPFLNRFQLWDDLFPIQIGKRVTKKKEEL